MEGGDKILMAAGKIILYIYLQENSAIFAK